MTASTVTRATFLFTDIEGSTRLLQQLGNDYAELLERHQRLLSEAMLEAGGRVFGSEGDALFASFPEPSAAVAAAAAAQRALAAQRWPAGVELRVRMGIHTGEAIVTGDNYVGLPLHQVARITNAGHGGMVLVSQATRQAAGTLPAGLELRDLGERRLKDLAMPERLYQLIGEGLATEFPPLRTLDARPNNLPFQLTSFVGREELAAARAALAETRLLTLSGPGGTGKTRLALQLAADVIDEFPDGVYFVALEALRDAELVAPAISAALGLTDAGSRPPQDHLAEHLRERRVLLLLDNLEQVVEAGAVVTELLRRAPELKVVVTSRVVLRVYGEHEFPVPPLGLPGGEDVPSPGRAMSAEAVRLFVERARAIQPTFILDEANVDAVVEIVRRLDGLPLAIELAAARVRILPVPALLSRLDSRLATLTGGARDLPARQQTLRGAIDWSHDLLDEPDRCLFARLAVFAGGAFLSELEAVCGPPAELGQEVLQGLSSLTEKSLLRSEISAGEEPRFTMLATLREYSLERLEERGESTALRERHAQTYLALVEACAPSLTGAQGRHWLDRLAHDHENVRDALGWLVHESRTQEALRFLSAAWRYWQIRGHLYEARERAEQVLAMAAVAEQPASFQTRAFGAAGSICYWQGDHPAAHAHYSRALRAAEESGDEALVAEAYYNFGFAPIDAPADDSAALYRAGREWFEKSFELYRRLGNPKGVADSSWALSIARAADGDLEGAIRYVREALEAYGQLDDRFGRGWALHMLASYQLALDRLDGARPWLHEGLSIFSAADDLPGILVLLYDFALLAFKSGDEERAWRLAGAADRLRQSTGAGIADLSVDFIGWTIPARPTGDNETRRAWDEGASMTTEQAVKYALAEAES
ncbi:MAG TPA: NB-ARC domain-containing protein [Candidatus Limnocylindria bacterium]|nr:NB-ARC domain-containing protein [Candidatus Limnocylindria bacterium]